MERMNFEGMFERARREVERTRNPEVVRLRATIERIIAAVPTGDPGTPPTLGTRIRQLEMILAAEPQRDAQGDLRYLLTSGLAVELTTGFVRPHHDIDLVIMDPTERRRWDMIGTDNVTPGEYWADMAFNAIFLNDTAREVRTRRGIRKSPTVEVVHPAIIMVQKASNAWGRPPRQRDRDDVSAIIHHWKDIEGYTHDWNPIVRQALDALPRNQFDTTLDRLRAELD